MHLFVLKAGENEKKLTAALKTIENLSEYEKKVEAMEEAEKERSLEFSALQKDKELFNMETEVSLILYVSLKYHCVHVIFIDTQKKCDGRL